MNRRTNRYYYSEDVNWRVVILWTVIGFLTPFALLALIGLVFQR